MVFCLASVLLCLKINSYRSRPWFTVDTDQVFSNKLKRARNAKVKGELENEKIHLSFKPGLHCTIFLVTARHEIGRLKCTACSH